MSAQTETILPCPFCGHAAEIEPWLGGGQENTVMCGAIDCDASPAVDGETRAIAISNWNRRAPAAAHSQMRSGAAEIVVAEIAAERARQIADENWLPEHDDCYVSGELALAAAAYALWTYSPDAGFVSIHPLWPFDFKWWKPKDHRRNLIRAAALIVAEIERIDRAATQNARDEQ